jgi:SAM-dependent methyltransferase
MDRLQNMLACPICKTRLHGSVCQPCGIEFGKKGRSFICKEMYETVADYDAAMRIIDFWGNGWCKRLEEPEHKFIYQLDAAGLRQYANESLAWHKQNKTLMGFEVALEALSNYVALNIGCGAGDEAIILASLGANCIAMDITAPAAEATDSLLRLLDAGMGIQGDARFLPFEDNSIDLVYSSGVLHHSPDISKSIEEIRRVLKPGGRAYIMLYATWSIVFMQEKLMRWSGEEAWETEGRKNPCTTTYALADCKRLFSRFQDVGVSKRGASLKQFAKIGRFLPASLDAFIDAPLGPNLNITAIK